MFPNLNLYVKETLIFLYSCKRVWYANVTHQFAVCIWYMHLACTILHLFQPVRCLTSNVFWRYFGGLSALLSDNFCVFLISEYECWMILNEVVDYFWILPDFLLTLNKVIPHIVSNTYPSISSCLWQAVCQTRGQRLI
jgi:hypothetical protein